MTAYNSKKHTKSAWVARGGSTAIQTPWGSEIYWPGFGGVHAKSLFIKKGMRTSLKYYVIKSEVLFIRSGCVEVYFGDELSMSDSVQHPFAKETLLEGDCFLVQSGSPYRILAIEDSEIIEMGNCMQDKPVRIEDDYGRV
tara:strand:- start:10809 stop:11228 length:420 start_codon:yes stop_codon:yes gene_type:complete